MGRDVRTAHDIVAAARDDEYGMTIPIRVDQVEDSPDNEWWEQVLHCSDVLGIHTKVTIFDDEDCELTDYTFRAGSWYEFDDVTPDLYGGTIGMKLKWERQVRPLSDRPEGPTQVSDETVRRPGDVDGIAALDIETISTVSELELEPPNPDHQEILCTGLGYRSGPGDDVETAVLVREGRSAEAELETIEAVVDWLSTREFAVLLTFGGAWFDLPVLVGRAERAAEEIDAPSRGASVRSALESFYHADLSTAKNRELGEGSLEDMADHVGSPAPETHFTDFETELEPRNWRGDQWQLMHQDDRVPPSYDLDDPVVFNSDVPSVGEALFDAREVGDGDRAAELRDCLETYTRADIEPLFAIADHETVAGQPALRMSY